MSRVAAELAVLCTLAASIAISRTSIQPALPPLPNRVYKPMDMFSSPPHPFTMATIEFDQRPGVRARATLWWHPGEYTPGPGIVTAIIQPGFRLRLQPITSRSGWTIAEQEYIVAHDLPISRRMQDGPSRPNGALLWDGGLGGLVVLTGDSTERGVFVKRTVVRFGEIREKELGPTDLIPSRSFDDVTNFRLPDSIEQRVGIGDVRRIDHEVEIDFVPWAMGELHNQTPILRARLSLDFETVISLDVLASSP